MTLEREVGALQARMETVEQELQGIRSDVREIRDALVTARGSWKALSLVVGLSVSLGAAVAKLLPFLLTPGNEPSSSRLSFFNSSFRRKPESF